MIIGYPLLKAFGLHVDVAHYCLKMSASLDGPKSAGPLDVDRHDLAFPLDVVNQGWIPHWTWDVQEGLKRLCTHPRS